MSHIYPIRLRSSLHETIWGGRRLERDNWKTLPLDDSLIGESWETEVSNVVLNGAYEGKNLAEVVAEAGTSFLGEQAVAIFGQRFPLLAKFIDANAQLSVQVHPDDRYAAEFEGGKLGKTEFWYILSAEPGATIVHGFKAPTDPNAVRKAIEEVQLEDLMHAEPVEAGDIVLVPAGTVHAIGSGIMLYELQEYSDVTYRMYDYGRLTAAGTPRELHIERSLDVSHYTSSQQIKTRPVSLATTPDYEERCLVACPYFLTRELRLKGGVKEGKTEGSCIILTSLGAEISIAYGEQLAHSETLSRGQTLVLPASLGSIVLKERVHCSSHMYPQPMIQPGKPGRPRIPRVLFRALFP
ncbi:type I phosphomannose isomerase catalytic subunit [Dictyobacter kobayashii]|uniref:Mannose-6-phosphate isomerase n=1 Tax=Dictyobacter kobayashii TaxID=2014872 RepID=A0A402AMZ1_9CHLR|nr:type I phosphomannose isomerase catalytic subunit [Dictyobacter kobayashii]GCE20452.1 mannose-6-phosphate isomerase [Dictyobacter kobayashii]